MEEKKKKLALADHWQERMSSYLGEPAQSLTPQQRGQIKALFRNTGCVSKRIINYAFDHWDDFTKQTMAHTGLPISPRHPHIGYLLKHRTWAIACMIHAGLIPEEDTLLELKVVKLLDM
jgi:hypothetical protein